MSKIEVKYIDHMGSELSVVNSARVSFGNHNKTELNDRDKKLVRYLAEHKHHSTFEHCVITLLIKCPLYIRSQIHRHRTFCVSGDTIVSFSRPDNGIHYPVKMSDLYRRWLDPAQHARYKNMNLRSFNESTKELVPDNRVTNVIYSGKKKIIEVKTESGKTLKCTPDHKLYTTKGWVEAGLCMGLNLATANGHNSLGADWDKVVSIRGCGIEPVYDLSAQAPHHSFIANGIIAHNCYNEISRRYTDKNLEFFVPDVIRKQSKSNRQASSGKLDDNLSNEVKKQMEEFHIKSLKLFEDLIEKGVPKEQARGVLPQNLMTEFYMTGNLRNWAHFINLRDHEGAQGEVQLVARKAKDIIIDKFGYAGEVILGQ